MDTSDRNKKAAARVDAQGLAGIAARAVERAQAARKEMTELSPEQTQAVSGAITASPLIVKATVLRPPIIYGGFPLPVDILKQQTF